MLSFTFLIKVLVLNQCLYHKFVHCLFWEVLFNQRLSILLYLSCYMIILSEPLYLLNKIRHIIFDRDIMPIRLDCPIEPLAELRIRFERHRASHHDVWKSGPRHRVPVNIKDVFVLVSMPLIHFEWVCLIVSGWEHRRITRACSLLEVLLDLSNSKRLLPPVYSHKSIYDFI